MNPRLISATTGVALLTVAAVAPVAAASSVEEIAGGLNGPRGLSIADDGSIIVAEAGLAGDTCPMGDAGFCFGPTGSIARVTDGGVERIVEGLPSAGSGPEVVGPSDVVHGADGALYAVINWGGDPSERQEGDLSGWILAIGTDGSVEPVADVAAFEVTDDPDAEFSGGVLDTNPHALVMVDDGFVVADAGANALLGVAADGTVSQIALFPPEMHEFPQELLAAMGPPPESDGEMAPEADAMAEGDEMAPEADGGEMAPEADAMAGGDEMAEGDAAPAEEGEMAPEGGMVPLPVESVPTSVAIGPDGAFYVGELTGGPFPVGGARIMRVEAGGQPEVYATGLTNVMDLGFGPDGTLYVAEIVHEGLMPVFMGGDVPPIGAVMAVPAGGGEAEVFATGEQLMALGGLAVADDGTIYASANTLVPGGGTLVRITP